MKKCFAWDGEKNTQLKEQRGITFEDVVFYIHNGALLFVMDHPNQEEYSHQRMIVIEIEGYIYLVPFVENKEEYFLKTIIPSRKATREFLKEE